MTRLALFCTRLIEAGWLLAAVMVPLYFNIFTTWFEPDKITLLRCITLIMLLAQVVLLIERRCSADARLPEPARPFWQVIRQDFLITAVIAYGAVYLLASLTSIDPAISLGGSYARLQGFYSLFSYLVVFGLIAVNMRQLSQVSRLVSVMALTGLPAALYGVLQASGQDPLLWVGDVTARVPSTMGNPTSIGAFMIMVLPLAIGRALGGRLPDATRQVDGAAFWRALVAITGAIVLLALLLVANHQISPIWYTYPAVLAIVAGVLVWVHEQLRRAAAWQVAVLFGVVAGFQLLCLVLSQSRGPFIGFLVGLPVFALLWTWQTRNRAMFSGLVAALGLLFVFLVFFNLPSSPLGVRQSATMGNPTSIGAFMIMVLPLAIGRALGGRLPDATRQVDGAAFWRALVAITGAIVLLALLLVANHQISPIWYTYPAVLAIVAGVLVWVHEQLRRAAAWQVAVLFGVVAGFQLLCLVLSQSRGPFIGFLVGLPVFALLWTWQTRNRAMFSGLVAALGLLFVFLVFFNLPSSPLGVLRSVPYFGRFGQLGQLDTGTGRIRVLFWQGTRELVTTWPQVGLEPDRLQFLRPLLGYGPETMAYAATRVYQPELGQVGIRPASVDRNHQDTLDHLVMTGLIGLVAYFVVLVAILLAGVRLVTTRVGARTRLMFVSFLGALAAHLIETQVGIAIAATLSYFWIIAGLIYASSRLIAEAEDERVVAAEPSQHVARPKRSQQRTRIRRTVQTPSGLARVSWLTFAAVAGAGLMVALSVVALSYDSYDEISKLMVFGFVGSWIGLVLLAWLLVRREKSPVVAISGGWQAYLAYLVLMLLVVGGIVQNLNQLSADEYHRQGQLYDRAGRYADSVVAYQRAFKLAPEQDNYALFVGRSLLEIAKRARPGGPTLLLSQYDELARSLPRAQVAQLTREDLLSSALVSLRRARDLRPLNTVHYAIVQNLNQLSADEYHRQGQLYDRAGRYADSVVAYQRAFKLAPEQDNYALFVGRSLLEIAKRARPGGPTLLLSQYDELARSLPRAQVAQLTREDLLSSALVSLRRARDLRPLNTVHYANLARLNRYWGDQGDPAKLQEASRYYSQATQLSPRDAHLYGEWALTELARKDLNSAREKSQKAISLDPRFAPGHVIAGDIELSAGQQPAAWKRHQAMIQK